MNKQELIEIIARNSNITKVEADAAIKAVLEGLTLGLKQDKSVQLIGFGTFEVKARAERKGRNPKTGEPIEVMPKKLPFFKVGKELKERILDGE